MIEQQRRHRIEKARASLKLSIFNPQNSPQGSDPTLSSPSRKNSWEEIQQFAFDFELMEKIGEGCNAVVKKCRRRTDGQLFAVKISACKDQQLFQITKKSYRLLHKLSHPNIVRVHALYLSPDVHTCHLLMDYLPLPSLRQEPLPINSEAHVRQLAESLLQTLNYVHNKGVCHRDIKPQNILHNKIKGKFTLIDFGISKQFKTRKDSCTMMTQSGTIQYQAPEILLGCSYSQKVDVWSIGVVLYQTFFGKLPFQSQYKYQLAKQIINQPVSLDQSLSPSLRLFFRRIFQKSPQERPNACELLKDPFILKHFCNTIRSQRTKSIQSCSRQAKDKSNDSQQHRQLQFFCKEIGQIKIGIHIDKQRYRNRTSSQQNIQLTKF